MLRSSIKKEQPLQEQPLNNNQQIVKNKPIIKENVYLVDKYVIKPKI